MVSDDRQGYETACSTDHTISLTQVAEGMHKGFGRRTVNVSSVKARQGGYWRTGKSRERVPIESVEDMVQGIGDESSERSEQRKLEIHDAQDALLPDARCRGGA
jgi:hypothetical protein